MNSKRIIPFFFLFILFSHLHSSAQTGIGLVSGVLIDSITSEPIEFAAISIKATGGTIILKSAMTDSAGRFKLENLSFGNYLLECSYIGIRKKRSR